MKKQLIWLVLAGCLTLTLQSCEWFAKRGTQPHEINSNDEISVLRGLSIETNLISPVTVKKSLNTFKIGDTVVVNITNGTIVTLDPRKSMANKFDYRMYIIVDIAAAKAKDLQKLSDTELFQKAWDCTEKEVNLYGTEIGRRGLTIEYLDFVGKER